MEGDKKELFQFSYSAKEQEEIRQIREKYQPKEEKTEENKMEQLRCLDQSVTKKGTIVALIAGIVGCLIFGTGMSLILAYDSSVFVVGIVTGIIGLIGVVLAYPLYMNITKKERERIAPQILRLTEELMK